MVFALVGDSTMTSAPLPPPAVEALGFRTRRLGATATATAVSTPPSSPGLRPGAALFRFPASFLAATHPSFVKRHASASFPSGPRLRKPDDLVHHLVRRLAVGVNT